MKCPFQILIDRGLVNNLLDMTRIEAGALSVTPKPTDVKTLIDEAKTAFLRRGARHDVEVVLDPNLPLIAADGRRMTQVLDNLLSNASKFSPESSSIRGDRLARRVFRGHLRNG